MDKNKTFQELFSCWKAAYPTKSALLNQADCVAYWNANKKDPDTILKKILDLKAQKLKVCGSLLGLFSNHKKTEELLAPELPTSNENVREDLQISQESNADKVNTSKISSPAQDAIAAKLNTLNEDIVALQRIKLSGLITSEQQQTLTSNEKEKVSLQKKPKRLKGSALRQQQFRKKWKQNVSEVVANHPELAPEFANIQVRSKPGRPRLEDHQPLLLQSIINIVSSGCSADQRRRSENLRFCRTLDDLHSELKNIGFSLSRAALYLRLLPRNKTTHEGKKHVKTVPVKLLRAPNDERKKHEDSHFAASVIKFLTNLAELLGPKCVFVCSQDDKAKVPLGIPAAKFQSPILMRVDYKVKLPDHDFVVAPQHKLIPSVYAGLCFDEKGKIGYSGPTYIVIRSGKHDKSSAKSHSTDFNHLIDLQVFEKLTKQDGSYKPIYIIKVDGGPDENPRFPSVLHEAIKNFKKLDLDALYIATNAPGYSAYNPVERRMAPLSKELSGLILPHEHYGTHLNGQGITIDESLEKKNFCKAGQCLAEVWSESVIDGHGVLAEFISSDSDLLKNGDTSNAGVTEIWKSVHVRQSQYVLQIVKCNDNSCCKPMKTNLKKVLTDGFLPTPIMFRNTSNGITACDYKSPENDGWFKDILHQQALRALAPELSEFSILPFDLYCPSVRDTLIDRVCKNCSIFFPSKVALKNHEVELHRIFSSSESILETIRSVAFNNKDDGPTIIEDLGAWLSSRFEEET